MKAALEEGRDDFNFHFYINSVKEGEIPWNFFVSLMKDLTQNLPKAQKLIEILLDELKNVFINQDSLPTFQNYEPSKVTTIVVGPNADETEDQKSIQHKLPVTISLSKVPQNSTKILNQIKIEDPLKVDHQKENAEIYECKKCAKSFTQKESINRHMNIVHGDKKHACSKCNKRFYSNFVLDRHFSAVHLEIKNHKCDQCSKSFSLLENLKNHVKFVHLNIRNHQCEFCDKRFQTRKDLRRHSKSHFDTKIFKCESCKKNFKRKTKL